MLEGKLSERRITCVSHRLCPWGYPVFLYTEDQTQLETLIKGKLQRALGTLRVKYLPWGENSFSPRTQRFICAIRNILSSTNPSLWAMLSFFLSCENPFITSCLIQASAWERPPLLVCVQYCTETRGGGRPTRCTELWTWGGTVSPKWWSWTRSSGSVTCVLPIPGPSPSRPWRCTLKVGELPWPSQPC